MSGLDTVVIAGAGHADGRVILVGGERFPPYERPPLSKEFLTGACGEERLMLHPADYYAGARIELNLGDPAAALEPEWRVLRLTDGTSLSYDRLVLALGASVRRLPIPGATLLGICYLRDIEDARQIRRGLVPGARVVVIGACFIGLEVASSAAACGAAVTARASCRRSGSSALKATDSSSITASRATT